MEHSRVRATAIALLVGVPALVLAALPALGLRMDSVRHAGDAERTHQVHGHNAVYIGRAWISGTVSTRLSPGVVAPITVSFHNSNPRAIAMRKLRVKIGRVSAPLATAAHPCGRVDFQIKQLHKRNLLIPAGRTTDLAGLGIQASRWPTLTMRNRPVNQDGCKGATVTLRFRTYRAAGR
jgi:hypothetical protein